MPRNVRNFFLDLAVDGRATHITTGPIHRSGGFHLTIKVRDRGRISENVLHIQGCVEADGTLNVTSERNHEPPVVLLQGIRD